MNHPILDMNAFAETARRTVAEGCVLLRNKNRALPLEPGCRTAVFGRAQMNYFKSGMGSGGMVNVRYITGIYEALVQDGSLRLDANLRTAYEEFVKAHPFDAGCGWATEPWFQQEMPLTESLVREAAARNDAALVIIGRTAGEDKDNSDAPGSFRLTDEEARMLELVCRHFPRTAVLLNTGNIIDMTWAERYSPAAILYVWQGGQDGGPGAADVVTGRISPSGRLTDTIARRVEDYPSHEGFGSRDELIYAEDIYVGYRYFESFAPDRVLYPFGYGLSYTRFTHEPLSLTWDESAVRILHRVTNIGDYASKEVVQVYAQLPQGTLGQPSRVLCGYAKTDMLSPGQAQDVELIIPADCLASYDDSGASGHRSCMVMERGEYRLYSGHNVREAILAGSFALDHTQIIKQLAEACAPEKPFDRLRPVNGQIAWEHAPLRTASPAEHRARCIPAEIPQTGDKGLRLEDVAAGRCSMEAFIAQLTDEDLCCIVRGEGMSSPRVTPGTAGAFGGVSDRLVEHFGIPTACCADGPSGIRMDCGNKAFAMPNGTCQACTWNDALIEELYIYEGLEMRKYQVDSLLGPGINIHRHPLCGRNFEYFSEDPLLTGRMAAAQLRGLGKSDVTGTIKHYACNNQEKHRSFVSAIVSERALRQIYLRAFEIAVREGGARSIMTSYNPLNGVYTASHYDLVTRILREQWGFTGIVMTDWWAKGTEEGCEPSIRNVAAMVRAQNDLFMVTGNPSGNSNNDDSAIALQEGRVTRAEYQRSAMNICRFVMDTPAFRRSVGQLSELDRQLQQLRDEDGDVILHIPEIWLGERTIIPGDQIRTGRGETTLMQMKLEKLGRFSIRVTCRAAAHLPATAQLPLSLMIDKTPLGMHTLSGDQKEWQTVELAVGDIRRRQLFYAEFFCAAGGLEIREVEVIRTETYA
ncbi:MAG: glycoside hydrolase family 3 protein [Clostridia bacterium]|nr:glycoside hydrolase family 3 protein [Clostridia bacterium]